MTSHVVECIVYTNIVTLIGLLLEIRNNKNNICGMKKNTPIATLP